MNPEEKEFKKEDFISFAEFPGDVKKTRGIVLIAVGSAYYGSWALNVAMSIKDKSPSAHITLFWKHQAKQFIVPYEHIFNEIKELPDHCVTNKGFSSYLKPKVCLYDISPYDETIFLDADVLMIEKDINLLFEKCKDENVLIGNYSIMNMKDNPKLIWHNTDEIRDVYGDECLIPHYSSEFIYFKKCEEAQLLFESAKYMFENPGVKVRSFANDIPDEHAFTLASMETGIMPKQSPFLPFYWENHQKKGMRKHEIMNSEFMGISMGGNAAMPYYMAVYNEQAKILAQAFGVKYPQLMYEKRKVIKERLNP